MITAVRTLPGVTVLIRAGAPVSASWLAREIEAAQKVEPLDSMVMGELFRRHPDLREKIWVVSEVGRRSYSTRARSCVAHLEFDGHRISFQPSRDATRDAVQRAFQEFKESEVPPTDWEAKARKLFSDQFLQVTPSNKTPD